MTLCQIIQYFVDIVRNIPALHEFMFHIQYILGFRECRPSAAGIKILQRTGISAPGGFGNFSKTSGIVYPLNLIPSKGSR